MCELGCNLHARCTFWDLEEEHALSLSLTPMALPESKKVHKEISENKSFQ
jgi:hypothetical protein